MGEGFTAIGEKAFLNCTNLESVTLPSTLFEIGRGAFKGCNSLKEVRTENMLTLCSGAFYGCPLESPLKIRCGDSCGFLLDSGTTLIVQGAGKAEPCPTLSNCQKLILQEGITQLVCIVDGPPVKLSNPACHYHPFGYCTNIKKLSLPSTLVFQEHDSFFKYLPPVDIIEVPLTCLLSGNAYRTLRSAGIPRNKIRIARHRKK